MIIIRVIYHINKINDGPGIPRNYTYCSVCNEKVWFPPTVFISDDMEIPLQAMCTNNECKHKNVIYSKDYIILKAEHDKKR